jgi:hypothetical protein
VRRNGSGGKLPVGFGNGIGAPRLATRHSFPWDDRFLLVGTLRVASTAGSVAPSIASTFGHQLMLR